MDFDGIRLFLEDYGLWSILIMLLAKFVTGVLVAIQKNEFKFYYLGNIFKTDFLKVATLALVTGLGKLNTLPQFDSDYVQGGLGAVLLVDLTAGVIKNLAHFFPAVADTVTTEFREPARLRLGNAKNIPTT